MVDRFIILPSVLFDIEGDAFGKIYEYFLGKFAMTEGQKGGEFFTPTSIVKLIVEVIEPYHGRIFDPACGSGGMFVQSARFVGNHKMNLAVHGLSGDIREGKLCQRCPRKRAGYSKVAYRKRRCGCDGCSWLKLLLYGHPSMHPLVP